jgi:polysaccharide deacetylase family protein (PEP-CTERM system associated)
MDKEKYILLTIDVEDWFQVENFKPWIPFETWDQRELRIEKNTNRLLDLFDSFEAPHRTRSIAQGGEGTVYKKEELEQKKYHQNPVNPVRQNKKKIQATFFILAWIAERLPNLVREIHSRGHEVASHGYNHNLCNQQAHADLKKDLTESKKLLEDIIGAPILGFRAPNFSIDDGILKLIEDCGYFYDSSYNSFGLHGRYGKISMNGYKKFGISHKISNNFFELPISNIHFRFPLSYVCPVKLFRKKHSEANLSREPSALITHKRFVLPWGGGGYFRLIPYRFFKHGLQSILKKDGAYVFYIHPWEFDSEQPKVDNAFHLSKFKHYTYIRKTEKKLKKLIKNLSHCQFITCSQYLDQTN